MHRHHRDRRVALVRLLATGAAATLLACGDSSGPPPPDPPSGGNGPTRPLTRVTPEGDSLTSINATVQLVASRSDGAPAAFTWTSSDTSVVDVSQTGRVRARGNGVALVIARTADAGADTARIVVRQHVAAVELTPGDASRPLFRSLQITATAVDAGGTPVVGTAFAWTTSDPERVTVDTTGLATARGLGIDTIRASAASATGTAVLTITAAPTPRFDAETLFVGAGQVMVGLLGAPPKLVVDSVADGEVVEFAVASSDDAIATVAVAGESETNDSTRTHALTITGQRPGTIDLSASAPRYRTGTAVVRVTTPRLLADIRSDGSGSRIGLQSFYSVPPTLTIGTGDSLGQVHRVTGELAVSARSSDPSVVQLASEGAVIATGSSVASLALTPIAAGRAELVVSAPGYRSDTVAVEIVTDGPRFEHLVGDQESPATVGVGQMDEIGYVLVRAPAGAPNGTVVTLTQSHPDLLRIPESVTKAVENGGRIPLHLMGLARGVDTVVASVPGSRPDTLVVHVTTPLFVSSADPSSETTDASWTLRITDRPELRLYVADSTKRRHILVESPVRVRVTSTDPSVLRPSVTSMLIESSGSNVDFGVVAIQIVAPGTAALRFEDEDGRYLPYTTPTFTVAPTRLHAYVVDGVGSKLTLGLGQSTVSDGLGVEMDYEGSRATPIHFHSTDPRVARPLVDSVLSSWQAGIKVVAGDVTGTAWIVASGPGLVPDSLLVEVGTPRFTFVRQSGAEGAMGAFKVRLLDHAGLVRSVVEPLEIGVSSSDPTVLGLSSPTLIFHAGAYESDFISWVALKAGMASLIVRDPRSPPRYDPEATPSLIVRP